MKRRKIKHLHIIDNAKKIFIIILCIVIIILIAIFTYSSFETNSKSSIDLGIAFFVVKADYLENTIKLDDLIEPDGVTRKFKFNIQNYDEDDMAEVNLKYQLTIKTTTNLPLKFDLLLMDENKKYNSVISNLADGEKIAQDENGTYFRYLTPEARTFGFEKKQVDSYEIDVTFPEQYRNETRFSDVIEGITIYVKSEQIIDGD